MQVSHGGRRPGGLDGFGESGQAIAAHDEHVAHPAVAQLGAHPGPELGAFGCLHPDPEYVFDPVEIHPDGDVRGSVADLVAVADFDHQRIEVDDRVDLLQRPRLPGLDLVEHRVGDFGDGVVGQLGAQCAGQVMGDVAHGHPTRIQRDDHVVEAAGAPAALGDQSGLKGPGTVARHVEAHVTDLGGQSLGGGAVA